MLRKSIQVIFKLWIKLIDPNREKREKRNARLREKYAERRSVIKLNRRKNES